MKRDMDLVREIMLKLEERPDYDLGPVEIEIEGYSHNQLSYHVMLLHEAGLIEAMDLSSFSGLAWRPKRLTWAGHEFIEASRDNSRWEKAKAILKQKSGGIVFDVLKALLVQLAKEAVFGA
jgi:hypothetical protein